MAVARSSTNWSTRLPGSGDPGYFSEGMYEAVICNDYPTPWNQESLDPRTPPQFQRGDHRLPAAEPLRADPPETWINDPASDIANCLTWPAPTTRMKPPIPAGRKMPGKLKTLVLAGEFDAITSVKEGRQVTRRFPRGRLSWCRTAATSPSSTTPSSPRRPGDPPLRAEIGK